VTNLIQRFTKVVSHYSPQPSLQEAIQKADDEMSADIARFLATNGATLVSAHPTVPTKVSMWETILSITIVYTPAS
jgi:hypothetical protein